MRRCYAVGLRTVNILDAFFIS